jgi:ABC-type glycerol-3-phosphate transport system permease component
MSSEVIGQNRKFGYTVAIALLVIAAYHIFIKHQQGWWVLFAVAIVLLLFALVLPVLLSPLRLVWDKIGHVLGIINTYILLTLFYFLILTPLGLMMRIMQKDILKLKLRGDQTTYWEDTPLNVNSNMKDQF